MDNQDIVITPHTESRKVRCLCGFPALCLLFELVAENHNLTLFVYKPCDVVFILF